MPLDSAVDVEDWANLRRPSHVNKTEMASLVLVPHRNEKVTFPLPVADLPEAIEYFYTRMQKPPGYLSVYDLVRRMPAKRKGIYEAARNGLLKPDAQNPNGEYLFDIRRIKEHIRTWENRHEVSPGWDREVAVITPFGMIRPRREPNAEVLQRVSLMSLNGILRRFSSRKKGGYNLTDMDGPQSQPHSMTIFASTSRSGTLTRPAKKRRRYT